MTETHVRVEKPPMPALPPPGRLRRLGRRIVEEGRTLVPTWLYFLLVFYLLRLMRTEILKERHMSTPPSLVLVDSLLAAKGILLVDMIPFVKKVERFPVFGAASLKILAYYVVLFFLQYIDVLIDQRHEGLAVGTREFGHALQSSGFWVNQIWLVGILFVYSATRELFRHLGPTKFREVFFGRTSAP